MNSDQLQIIISLLTKTPSIVSTMLTDLPDGLIFNNEGVKTWSPYDIVGHLIHGEKTDWIPRAKIILEYGESKTFTPFDKFAQEKDSVGKTLKDLLEEFKTLREQNIQVLTELKLSDEDYEKTGIHPDLGKVSLKQLLTTWVVHDLDHIAQISRVISHQFKTETGPWKKHLRIIND